MSDDNEMENLVSDITGQKIDKPADVSHETPPQTPEAPKEPARDESGRFVAKPADQPEPVETPAAAAPSAAPAEPPKTVDGIPLAVALEWKSELKEAKKRLAEFEESRSQQPDIQVPSPLEDPDGYALYQADLVNRAQTSARFDTSELIARSAHGDDAVQKAMDWGMERAQASPAFAAEYLRQRHPIDWAVKQMKREELMSKIGDDPDAYVRARWAELNATQTSPQPVPTNGAAASPQPAAPRQPSPQRSLAAQPTAGSHTGSVPMGLEATLDAVFPR